LLQASIPYKQSLEPIEEIIVGGVSPKVEAWDRLAFCERLKANLTAIV
jgi:hypothetical protein